MAKKYDKYYINDKRVPSVTTILSVIDKPELDNWRVHVGEKKANQIKEDSAQFGTLLHSAIDSVLNTKQKLIITDSKLEVVIDNFISWTQTHVKKFLSFEQAIYYNNEKENIAYAGTVDGFYIDYNDRLVMYDLKTSKKIVPEYHLQLTAYRNGHWCEDPNINLSEIDRSIIIHLNHQTLAWEDVVANTGGDQFDTFLAAYKIYEWMQSTK